MYFKSCQLASSTPLLPCLLEVLGSHLFLSYYKLHLFWRVSATVPRRQQSYEDSLPLNFALRLGENSPWPSWSRVGRFLLVHWLEDLASCHRVRVDRTCYQKLRKRPSSLVSTSAAVGRALRSISSLVLGAMAFFSPACLFGIVCSYVKTSASPHPIYYEFEEPSYCIVYYRSCFFLRNSGVPLCHTSQIQGVRGSPAQVSRTLVCSQEH